MTKANILERMSISKETVTTKDEQLATEALLVLGYKPLANKILPVKYLSQVLRELEIEPYALATVEAYKHEKLEEAKEATAALPKKRDKSRPWVPIKLVTSWKLVPLEEYKQQIPNFVLRKAIQIKRACPNVTMLVDELRTDKVVAYRRPRNSMRHDPFLVAQHGGEKFYIEVWDERKFENEL